jgi:hypothetical protein
MKQTHIRLHVSVRMIQLKNRQTDFYLLRGIRFMCYVHAFYTSLVHNRPSSDNSMKYLKRIAISSFFFLLFFSKKIRG